MNMGIEIRQFTAADTEEAIAIWNDVVADGVAFPQTEELDARFLKVSPLQESQKIRKRERLLVSISCIPTTSDVADISATQAMPYGKTAVDGISANS